MMQRRKRANPVSLFAFQDIITGLCGVMIFMVLVQVVGLAFEGMRDERVFKPVACSTESIDALKAEIKVLENELSTVKIESSRAVLAIKGKARQEDVQKINKQLTEKELVLAALISQVHDLETQVESAKKTDAEDAARIKEMERTRRLLEQQISGLKGRRGVTLIPERGEFKIPVYMICSWSGIEVQRPFEKVPKVEIAPDALQNKLDEYIAALDHTTHAVVLLVRPSGVKIMSQAVEILKSHSFTYGRDPLEENLEVAFNLKESK